MGDMCIAGPTGVYLDCLVQELESNLGSIWGLSFPICNMWIRVNVDIAQPIDEWLRSAIGIDQGSWRQ